MTAEQREALESFYCDRRIIELALRPVHGNFDASHLKEINRRIFQDLPAAGLDDVKPGEYRPQVSQGGQWMKNRGLSTVKGAFLVAYSRMDKAAQVHLDKTLEEAKPDQLRGLKTPEFTAKIADLYARLDYIHPFSDGNSRTLRVFTKQLANEANYEIDWERFGRDDKSRDLLCIARDLSVNKLAMPYMEHERVMQQIAHSMYQLRGYGDLASLLRDVIRPSLC